MKEGVLSIIFPERCVGCDKYCATHQYVSPWWCDVCERARHARGVPLRRIIAGSEVIAAATYSPAVARAIHGLKYRGIVTLADTCAAWVAASFQMWNMIRAVPPSLVVFVPIPLHARRLRERGFNQTELLAQALCARTARTSCAPTLVQRIRHTMPQVHSDRRARMTQVAHVFEMSASCDPRMTYVLIDDVVTTGATLAACIHTMRRAGARRILACTISSASLKEEREVAIR